jgi:hypothetical protein
MNEESLEAPAADAAPDIFMGPLVVTRGVGMSKRTKSDSD